ncbi:amidohydrolase family protein [Bradyrhizobium sp. I71]|uniref:amidohydrolase family protein n=1 Tax=Bradyrhizobium sp. I71 TaxID=2590772 RepID=UPI001EF8FA1B|nr:amidohydrolase family protein [Bradyrhizobium sp. I71]ULK96780.1 amidohydrolase family protein [Bradyrhizobium sp. I71]
MSGRPQSIRFVSGRIYRDASDRLPADTLVTQNGAIVGVQDEAPSRSQTIASYLQGGADVLRQKSWRGTLRAGSAADLVALDQDPFDSSVDLRSVKTLMTVVRGTIGRDASGSQHFKAAEVFN